MKMKIYKNTQFKQSRKSTNAQEQLSEVNISLMVALQQVICPKIISIKRIIFNKLQQNKSKVNKNTQKQQFMQAFMNHCAILIQTNYKGFIQRKKYKLFLPIYRRFKQIFLAAVKGWKTRKILKLTMFIKNKSQIFKNITLKKEKQVRIGKRQFLDDFHMLFKNGNWIQILKKQPKYTLKSKIYLNKQNLQNNNKGLPLYENIKPVKSLKSCFKQQKSKYAVKKLSDLKEKQIQSKKSNNNLRNRSQQAQQRDNCIKVKKLQSQTEKQTQTQSCHIKKKKNNQLQIHIEPETQCQISYFTTPKQNNRLNNKRTLNIANTKHSKNKLETSTKQKENNNVLNDSIQKKQLQEKDSTIQVRQSSLKHINNNQQIFLETNTIQKKRQKKGLGMTLSKHFQFQINDQINNFNKTQNIKFRKNSQNKQISTFDDQNNVLNHNEVKLKRKLMDNFQIKSIQNMKCNFQKKKIEQSLRHQQLIKKIQMSKNNNPFI